MTGQVLSVVLSIPKGLNPSATNPSLTLRGSDENCKCLVSNIFHAFESAGCRITLSSGRPLTCHFIELARSGDKNSRCNLGFKGNHHRIFANFFFPLLEEALLPVIDASFFFHLLSLQQGHASRLTSSFQNSIQSFGQAWVFL